MACSNLCWIVSLVVGFKKGCGLVHCVLDLAKSEDEVSSFETGVEWIQDLSWEGADGKT
jgi:hypothetical protein